MKYQNAPCDPRFIVTSLFLYTGSCPLALHIMRGYCRPFQTSRRSGGEKRNMYKRVEHFLLTATPSHACSFIFSAAGTSSAMHSHLPMLSSCASSLCVRS